MKNKNNSEKIKKCHQCGSKTFYVSAHVVQDWKVDCHGTFIEAYDECSEVTHRPDNNDTWECANCGHIVIGEKAPEICPVCAHPQSYFMIKPENY